MVDYMLTPHDCYSKDTSILGYSNIVDFNVGLHIVSDILLEHDLYTMLTHDCKAPGHSMLVGTLLCSNDLNVNNRTRLEGAGKTTRRVQLVPPEGIV